MIFKPILNSHADERLKERTEVSRDWLVEQIELGNYVLLKGKGKAIGACFIMSGYLIYLAEQDTYCLVVVDDRFRKGITVLSERMIHHSTWNKGFDEKSKLRAKRLILGEEIVNDSQILSLRSKEGLPFKVRIRSPEWDTWEIKALNLCKINIFSNQFNTEENSCYLDSEQRIEVEKLIQELIISKSIYPFAEVFIANSHNRQIKVTNVFKDIGSLEEAAVYYRWLKN